MSCAIKTTLTILTFCEFAILRISQRVCSFRILFLTSMHIRKENLATIQIEKRERWYFMVITI